MIKIAPSMLASDFSELGNELRKIEAAGADLVHIDVMDGHFVPNISMGPVVVKSIRKVTRLPFDVHLMIENPDSYIDDFIEAGANIISVHPEVCRHLDRTLQKIHKQGVKACAALNPATSLSVLDWVMDKLDMVLIMTVNPGFGGQSYIDSMTEKVRQLKKLIVSKGLNIDIEVDGGIGLDNIYRVTEAGAGVIVAGTTVFKAPDTAAIIRQLKETACGI